ncbi:hypothetical protein [Faecalibacterium taiwanense]|uniref:hypothetical protein n=1 Tax=Faecalibacterium taiwanense TaxID=3030638 RepID=UPI00321ABCFF
MDRELPGSSYSHKGKTYHVVKQGFARDVEHTLVRADENEIVLELRSSPELKATQFPLILFCAARSGWRTGRSATL